MDFSPATYALGLLAGLLSALSPCVLPLIPILLGSATTAHRRAPLALAAGLALSYAIVGTSLAWAGATLDLDPDGFRWLGAGALGLLGAVMMSSGLQQRFARATAGIGDAGNTLLARLSPEGLRGQFAIGLALGLVWSPCVGPTLGAAIVFASQGAHLPQVALLMGVFGVGAALPVLALGYVSRSMLARARGRLVAVGKVGRFALGAVMLLIAALILSGADKPLETWLLDHSPAALTALTTRF